jgi:hypothetical protein
MAKKQSLPTKTGLWHKEVIILTLIPGNVNQLIPAIGFHLKNIHTDEVFEGNIYLAKSLSEKDFIEITEEEYQVILAE